MRGSVPERIVVLSVPRSGSSWLYGLIYSHHCVAFPESQALSEFFGIYDVINPLGSRKKGTEGPLDTGYWIPQYELENGKLQTFRQFLPPMLAELLEKEGWKPEAHSWLRKEMLKRLSIVKGLEPRHYVLKSFATDFEFGDELLQYFSSDHYVICLERRDRIAQILSYCLSRSAHVWNSPSGDQTFPDRKVPASRIDFDHMIKMMRELHEIKARMGDPPTVYYEDLLQLGDENQVLAAIGLGSLPKEHLDKERIGRFKRNKDYIDYFSNRDEVEGWIKEFFGF